MEWEPHAAWDPWHQDVWNWTEDDWDAWIGALEDSQSQVRAHRREGDQRWQQAHSEERQASGPYAQAPVSWAEARDTGSDPWRPRLEGSTGYRNRQMDIRLQQTAAGHANQRHSCGTGPAYFPL